MNNKNVIILAIVIVFSGIIGLIIGYLFFKTINSGKTIIKENNYTTGQVNTKSAGIEIDIDAEDPTIIETVDLEIKNGTSDTTKSCEYDLVYTPKKVFVGLGEKELTLTGQNSINGNGMSSLNDFVDIDLNNVDSKIVLIKGGKFEVSGAGNDVKLTWAVTMKYSKSEQNYNYENKTYGGILAIENVNCKER